MFKSLAPRAQAETGALTRQKTKLLSMAIAVTVYVSAGIVSIRDFLFSPGVVGLRHDWSTPPFDYQLMLRLIEPFYLWSANGYSIRMPAFLYYRLFEDTLILASTSFELHFSKIVIISLLALSGFTSYLALRYLKFGFMVSLLSGLLYLSTPVIFNRVVAGYLPYLFAYAMLPLIISTLILGIREKSIAKLFVSAILFGLSISQLQFIVLVPILAASVAILFIIRKRDFQPLWYLLGFLGVGLAMHAFWILPLFPTSGQVSLTSISPSGYHEIIGAPTPQEALAMIGYTHQYDYTRILPEVYQAILIIPVLVGLSCLVMREKSKFKQDLRIVGIVSLLLGLFLVTATNSPIGGLWSFLFDNVSPMKLLREVYHSIALVSFGILILFALSIQQLSGILRTHLRRGSLYAVVAVGTILLAQPVFSGDFHGQLQSYAFPQEYDLSKYELDRSTRILMIPAFEPIKYENLSRAHLDPMLTYPPTGTFPQLATPDNRMSQVRNFIVSDVDEPEFKDLLEVLGVSYIVVRKNVSDAYFGFTPRGSEAVPFLDNSKTIELMDKQFTKVQDNERLAIYQAPAGEMFGLSSSLLLSGGNFESLGSVLSFSDNHFVMASDLLADKSLLNLHPLNGGNGPVIIRAGQLNEYIFSSFEDIHLIIPYTGNLLPSNGWTSTPSGTWWWKKAFISEQFPYNNIVFNDGLSENRVLEQTIQITEADRYKIFARMYENSEGGSLIVSIDNYSLFANSRSDLSRFTWIELGEMYLESGDHKLYLNNLEGFNAVSSFVLAPVEKYEQSRIRLTDYLRTNDILYIFDGRSDLNSQISIAGSQDHSYNSSQEVEILKDGYYGLSADGEGLFYLGIDEITRGIELNGSSYGGNPIYLTKGTHTFSIDYPELEDLASDLKFDKEQSSLELSWSLENEAFESQYVVEEGRDGIVSVSTQQNARQWSWIRSTPVAVDPTEEYLVTTSMKHHNTNSTHIKLEGFFADQDSWKQLNPYLAAGGTGTSEWKEYRTTIFIPENVTSVRAVLNAGWVLDETQGAAITQFDDVSIHRISDAPVLNSLILYSTNPENKQNFPFTEAVSNDMITTTERVNPTLWKASIKTDSPVVLSFAEGYDPEWEALIYKDNKLVAVSESIPLYSAINGFAIDQVGDLEIIVQYKPQQLFDFGLAVSMATLAGSVGFASYLHITGLRKRKAALGGEGAS